jgi:ribose/xylose/arabinose/galactoside ABC-type transport system permease subunit
MTTTLTSSTGVAESVARSQNRRIHVVRTISRWGLPLLLLVLVVVATITTSDFMTFDNIRAILINTAIVGIVAVGMTPVTLSGNFFSLGAAQSTMLATALFLVVVASGAPIVVGMLVAVVVLVAVGIVQALVVAAGLNPVITTLAVGSIIYGAVTFATGGSVVTAQGADIGWLATSSFLGLPLPVYVFFVFTIVVWFLVDKTVPGRRISLVGANRESAKISGISVRATTIWAFVSMSLGMAIAGVLSAAQLGQVTSNDLSSLTIDTVAAVLVGGTAIQGGEGSPVRSAVGALIIVILGNVMLLHGLPTGLRMLGVGALVVIVVSVLHVLRKVAAR